MNSFIAVCTALAAISGGLWAVPRIYAFWMLVSRASIKLDRVVKQFEPNSGTSLIDRLENIETSHAALLEVNRNQSETLSNHGIMLSDIGRRIEAIEDDLKD